MEYFFTPGERIPAELGTPVFSETHLAWLICAAAAILFICIHFARHPANCAAFVQKCAVVMALSEVARQAGLIASGAFSPAFSLPLHLCAVMEFVTLFAVYTKQPLLYELCWCFGLPGGVMAMLTPGETACPFFNVFYWQFILCHFLLALIPLLTLVTGFRPHAARLPACFAFLTALAGICMGVNDAFGGNYMFLRFPSPASPLEPLAVFGRFYIPALALLVLAVWLLLYGGCAFVCKCVKRRRPVCADQAAAAREAFYSNSMTK